MVNEVHALLWSGTHGLKLYVTTMTISNVGPMCEMFFTELGNSAN